MNLIYEIGKRKVEVSSPEKILFPESGITKKELVDYYARIADIMVPYMENRPITMHRYPEGIAKEGFYQKDAADYFPQWIKRKVIKKRDDGVVRYVVCNEPATLVYLAQQACITPHIWLSKIDKLHYPDRLIFDLDPGKQSFAVVRETALALKELLDHIKMESFVMTTGSKGLHVAVPLDRTARFAHVRDFAQNVAQFLIHHDPKRLTMEIRIASRKGRLFIDTLRNSFGATGVAPYAVRARPNAPVATPLDWEEVKNPQLRPDKYTIKNMFRRLSKKNDPWRNIDKKAYSVKAAQSILDKIME